MSLITGLSLHKDFRRGPSVTHAVRGVSLEIHRGESVAIVGASGCGKTTLLNMIGLITTPDSGELLIAGQNAKQLLSTQRAAHRSKFFGYIVQDFALIEDYTALENAEIPLIYGPERLGRSERRRRVQAALSRVGLEDKTHQQARRLSGGQRQRVAIARALVSDPQVILADEPTGSLDAQAGEDIFRFLIELVGAGKTLVLVTHNLDLAERCGRQLRMRDGKLV